MKSRNAKRNAQPDDRDPKEKGSLMEIERRMYPRDTLATKGLDDHHDDLIIAIIIKWWSGGFGTRFPFFLPSAARIHSPPSLLLLRWSWRSFAWIRPWKNIKSIFHDTSLDEMKPRNMSSHDVSMGNNYLKNEKKEDGLSTKSDFGITLFSCSSCRAFWSLSSFLQLTQVTIRRFRSRHGT